MDIPLGNTAPPGWASLVQPLIERAEREGAKVVQVKEKFGTLRFYVDDASDGLTEDVRRAELASASTCEECGAPATLRALRGGNLLRTLCDEHAAAHSRS